ncbi:MAG TPA: DUF2490 domain-containing protein [Saprospiraceae bacterium]|nr:DUF2490 domain-containing protein [Saprospiraceae bacterium]
MMINKWAQLFLLFLFCCHSSIAQQRQAYETWATLNLDYQFSKKWLYNISNQYRAYPNPIGFKSTWIELGTEYKLNKKFNLEVSARFVSNRKSDRTRYSFGATYKDQFWKAKLAFKVNYFIESKMSDYDNEFIHKSDHILRLRLISLFKITKKKLTAGPLFEYRTDLRNLDLTPLLWRHGIAVKYDLNKRNSFSFLTFQEFEFPIPYKLTFVSNLSYTYLIK